jgi:hypothetical protein
MKAPPTFKTGDPSYFVTAWTFGSASPTSRTVSNVSEGARAMNLRVISSL